MATTGAHGVNRPMDAQQKEADVHRKLQLYGIFNAFQNGKVPSNDQIDVALNSLLETPAIVQPSKKLSPEGRTLVEDFRNVVLEAKKLLLSKNSGDLLQDFIFFTQHAKAVNVPAVPLDKENAQQHGDMAIEGLRTLGTLIISNGQFRKLLKDATTLMRDIAGDAATNAAGAVKPHNGEVAQIDRPADDNTWHDMPDLSSAKEALKKQIQAMYSGHPKADAKAALSQGTQAAHPSGSSNPQDLAQTAAHDVQAGTSSGIDASAGVNAAANTLQQRVEANVDPETKEKASSKAKEYRARVKQYLGKKMPHERREQTVWRLKKMIIECQQHPDYQRAIQTLLDLAAQYGAHASKLVRDGSGTVNDARSEWSQAERHLKTLIERFANGTSTDNLWEAFSTISKDADKDEDLKNWFKSMNKYIRRCLQEQGYIMEDDSTEQWNQLYDHGNYLLRDKYRAHTDRVLNEIKGLADQFDQDAQNKAFASALTKLFTNLGNDRNGKPTFKPHLVKDLSEVILPAMFEKIAYIPVPRVEYSDDQIDVVIENLILESDNFMPNILEIASENYVRWGRRKVANARKHTFEIKVKGIQMDLRDVSYYVKRKHGFPAISDTGVANILLSGDGFSFKLKMSTADEKDKQHFFKIDKLDVDVKHLSIKLVQSKHKLIFTLFNALLLKVLRPALQKTLEKTIRNQINRFDALLFQIKKEADRALEQAQDNPDHVPNIYRRYLSAAQKQLLQGKEKVEDFAVEKKVNYAVTKEESIFPHIHLPGGISSKATEYKELARQGEKWQSPVFSIGHATKSKDVPVAPEVTKKTAVPPAVPATTNGHSATDSTAPVDENTTPNGSSVKPNGVNETTPAPPTITL